MASTWRVVNQRQYEELTGAGTFVPVIEVTFETTNGVVGSVKIPERQYTEDNVRQVIDAKAKVMLAVDNL